MNVEDTSQSKKRWVVAFLLFVIAAVSYLDRTNISVAAPVIAKQFHFTPEQLGVIFSSFTWAYVLGQIPGGLLAGAIGPRKVYFWGMWIWGFIIIINIFAVSYASWIGMRIPFGLVEALAWPAAAVAVSRWFPRSEVTQAMGVQNLGLVVGPALAPPIVAFITADYGWQTAFVVTGVLAWVIATIWYMYFRDLPENHRGVSSSELKYIRQDRLKDDNVRPVPGLSKVLLKCPSIWAAGFSNFGQGFVNFMFLTWFPSYLVLTYHLSLKKMGILAMLPYILGLVTIPASGYISSYLLRKTHKVSLSRKLPLIIGLTLAALFLFLVPTIKNMYGSIVVMSLGYACSVSILGPQWSTPSDVGGKIGSGFAGGFINFIGGIGGIISPLLMGFVFQVTGSFVPAIITAGAIDIVVVVLFWFMYRVETDQRKVQDYVALSTPSQISADGASV